MPDILLYSGFISLRHPVISMHGPGREIALQLIYEIAFL